MPSSYMTSSVEGWMVSPRKSRRKSACFSSTTTSTPARASRKPEHHAGGAAAGDGAASCVIGLHRPPWLLDSSPVSALHPSAACGDGTGHWKRGASAVQRILGVPAIGDSAEARLEGHRRAAAGRPGSRRGRAAPSPPRPRRAADHAGDRAENAGLGTWRDRALGRRLGEQAAIRRARIAGGVASRRRGRW